MQEDPELNGAERELEAALSSLRPRAASLNRDELLFQAGYRRGRRAARPWQLGCGLMLTGLLSLAVLRPWDMNPAPMPHEVVENQPRPAPAVERTTNGTAHADRDSRRPYLIGSHNDPAQVNGAAELPLMRRVRLERLLGISPQDVGGPDAYQRFVRPALGDIAL